MPIDSCTITLMAEMNTPGGDASQVPTPDGGALPPNQTDQSVAQVVAPGSQEQPVTGWAPVVSEANGGAADAPVNGQPADGAADYQDAPVGDAVTWTASEFVAHHKTTGWYVMLFAAALVGAGAVYLFTHDIISSSVVIIAAVFFGVFAARQPRELRYSLDGRGVQIGAKYYSLAGFRSFSVVPEGGVTSIILMPLRRFAPLTTLYFADQDESRIVDILSLSLPLEEYRHDVIDQFLHRIRF